MNTKIASRIMELQGNAMIAANKFEEIIKPDHNNSYDVVVRAVDAVMEHPFMWEQVWWIMPGGAHLDWRADYDD